MTQPMMERPLLYNFCPRLLPSYYPWMITRAMNDEKPSDTPTANAGGHALRAFRSKLAETQAEFGKRYGLTFNAVSRYERGEYLPDLRLAVQFEADGICSCRSWCDPAPDALAQVDHAPVLESAGQ